MVASLNRCYGIVVCHADCKDIVTIVTPAIVAPRRQAGEPLNAARSILWRNGAFEKPPPGWPVTGSGGALSRGNPCYPGGLLFETSRQKVELMSTILKWALVMLLVSLVAALFGFTGVSAASADIARILFYIFIVLFVVLLVLGLTAFRTVRGP